MRKEKIGAMVFMVAIGIAVVLGLLGVTGMLPNIQTEYGTAMMVILVIAGITVGILNIDKSEEQPLMIAGIVLSGASAAFALIPTFGNIVNTIFQYILPIVAGATAVVALKTFYDKARN